MTTIVDQRISDVKEQRLVTAGKFIEKLPVDQDGPDRSLAFRALMNEARCSNNARKLVREIYRQAGNGELVVNTSHDLHMFVSGIAECLDLLPLVRRDIDRLVCRCFVLAQNGGRGLWLYIQELYERRRTMSQQRCVHYNRVESISRNSVLWSETRGEGEEKELFFVEAKLTPEGWVCEERSSFEVTWQLVHAASIRRCIEKAEEEINRFVRSDLERYLAHCFMDQNRVNGLWLQMQELAELRCTTLRRAEMTGVRGAMTHTTTE